MSSDFKLNKGDEIRIIAPSQSWSKKCQQSYNRAQKRLESAGYKVTFGKNIKEIFHEGTASRELRADDFNEAYSDTNVKLIMTLSGGWSANEILDLIDWNIVKNSPKPLVGFSDITILINAIYKMTGQVCYLGPNFSTLGKMVEWKYTLANFISAVNGNSDKLHKSQEWSEKGKIRHKTKSWKTLQPGIANATLIGGNIGTLYQPNFNEPFIFALEDDDEAYEYTGREVSRRFESLLQLPNFRENLRGLIVGRFQPDSKLSDAKLESIILSKNLGDIPIATRIDFGHTIPILTLPIGRKIKLDTTNGVDIWLN